MPPWCQSQWGCTINYLEYIFKIHKLEPHFRLNMSLLRVDSAFGVVGKAPQVTPMIIYLGKWISNFSVQKKFTCRDSYLVPHCHNGHYHDHHDDDDDNDTTTTTTSHQSSMISYSKESISTTFNSSLIRGTEIQMSWMEKLNKRILNSQGRRDRA